MRSSKNEYYLQIAKEVGKRSTCFRNKGGAIIVRDDQIVSTGYIGAPRNTKDCLEREECLRNKLGIPHGQRYEICRSVHAEQNAIINAARAGVSLLRGTMYLYIENQKGEKLNSFPCYICKKIIINAGLDKIICSVKDGGIKMFEIGDWIEEWKKSDILDDKYQYGKDQNKND